MVRASRQMLCAAGLFGLAIFAPLARAQTRGSVHPTIDRMAPLPDSSIPPETPVASPADYSHLRPGTFRWMPQARRTGTVEIVVSLPNQRGYIFRGGALIGVSTISAGRAGHETPSGDYHVLEKDRDHRSNIYSNGPMPFMQRLTWDGLALHGGVVPGHPASHGCVRFPVAFARILFDVTRVGARVHIIDAEIEAEDAAYYLDTPPPLETVGTN